MKQTITFSQFVDAFRDMRRENNFTYEGKKALFEYLEEYEASTGTAVELDIIALCCEYSEYSSFEELKDEYDLESDDFDEAMNELDQNTMVISREEGCILIQQY